MGGFRAPEGIRKPSPHQTSERLLLHFAERLHPSDGEAFWNGHLWRGATLDVTKHLRPLPPYVAINQGEWQKPTYFGHPLSALCHMLHDQPDHLEQRRINYSSV